MAQHITPLEFLAYLEEKEYSIVSQPFYRFFDIIEKEFPDKVNFSELLPALVSFSLFTRSEILGFVFSMIDEDRDQKVSKQDIFK